jgi:hypothetical protein
MTLLSQLAALLAIVSTGIVYGTDAFCALVQRSALARVDDATLTAMMGNVHRFGDRRMPAPGILGIIAAAAASVLAAVAGHRAGSAAAGPPPTPAPCNGTGTASSSPEPSCRAWPSSPWA